MKKEAQKELPYDESNADDRQLRIAGLFSEIMKTMGLNLNDPSLAKTPMRVAKMYDQELFAGVHQNPPEISTFPNTHNYDQMIIVRDIELASTCEHHFLPFIGKCHIAYFPKDVVVGLSKFNRVVRYFAARPQIQEKLVHEISGFFKDILETENVAVIISAEHFCAKIRGVRDSCSSTVTQSLGGLFREPGVRNELFEAIKMR
jgi:GTP cyclohydrolase I